MTRFLRRTMMLKFLLTATLVCLFAPIADGDQEITPLRKVSGKLPDAILISHRPTNGVIKDSQAFKLLWTAWRPDDQIPNVDFETQIVLIETAPGPNMVLTDELMLDDQGELTFAVGSTRNAGSGFGYLVIVIPKKGIQSVNGNNLNSSPSTPDVADSIKIDMTGKIETGIMATGGETTGTRISSGGIVWELDLQDHRELIQTAQIFDASTVRVKGNLIRIKGTEVEFRWIVKVESIAPAGSLTTNQSDPRRPTAETENRLVQPRKREPVDIAKIKKSYKTIVVETTGGPSNERQKLTITADGTVTNEIAEKEISTSWTIPPVTLEKLHRFIDQTDWRKVPRLTRSDVPDAFNYEISIDRSTGLTRIFIDSPSIADQPTINLLFRFFRREKN